MNTGESKGMEMDLLLKVERYLRRSGTAPTRFGRDAVHDPRFVFDLRNGREPRPQTQVRVADYLASREQEGAPCRR